jgi:outer membrane autotransporter protein
MGSTAAYDAKLFSLAGEAGYDTMLNGWQLTPHFGAHWTSVSTGAFTKTGPFVLKSTGSNTGFGKVWLGLNAERKFDTWTLSGHARVIAYGDDSTTLPVSFTGSSALMALTGANRGTFGAEAGIAAHMQLSTAVSAFGSYDIKLRDSSVTHAGMLGLKMKW